MAIEWRIDYNQPPFSDSLWQSATIRRQPIAPFCHRMVHTAGIRPKKYNGKQLPFGGSRTPFVLDRLQPNLPLYDD
jgi:hypothetical protein